MKMARNVILFAGSQSAGVTIAYPTIGVTAQDRSDVLLELNFSHANTADEDVEFMQLRIIPGTVQAHESATSAHAAGSTHVNGTANGADSAAKALFRAISDCQELNPDPPGMNDEGDGDETAPGATGWMTSENMADFMDENGEFRMPASMTMVDGGADGAAGGSLGAGAGRVRTADELVDGEDGEDEESKWQRTG